MTAKPTIKLIKDTLAIWVVVLVDSATQLGCQLAYRFADVPASGHAQQCLKTDFNEQQTCPL
jgi:hypothetical protein